MPLPDVAVRTAATEPVETHQAPVPQPDPPPIALSRWSKSLLATISLLIAALTALQLVSMFLGSAPRNTVSQRYRGQLSWWTEPWLEQDWRLFAPDPQTSNLTIRARARRADGTTTGWVDLTAADYAAIVHDPMPSQANQNELRRAWGAYLASQATSGTADSTDARLLKRYLANIAALRLAGTVAGPITAVQLQSRSTPIALPGAAAHAIPKAVSTPWFTL